MEGTVNEGYTAGDLVSERRCSPMCLLAAEDGACTCVCEGEWHGALLDTPILNQRPRPWYEAFCGWAQPVLDATAPVVSGNGRIPGLYSDARRREGPYVRVWGKGSNWRCEFDLEPAGWNAQLTTEAGALFHDLLMELMKRRRVYEMVGGGGHYFMIRGIRSRVEAQVLGTVLYELWMGNLDGATSCLLGVVDPVRRLELAQ